MLSAATRAQLNTGMCMWKQNCPVHKKLVAALEALNRMALATKAVTYSSWRFALLRAREQEQLDVVVRKCPIQVLN